MSALRRRLDDKSRFFLQRRTFHAQRGDTGKGRKAFRKGAEAGERLRFALHLDAYAIGSVAHAAREFQRRGLAEDEGAEAHSLYLPGDGINVSFLHVASLGSIAPLAIQGKSRTAAFFLEFSGEMA